MGKLNRGNLLATLKKLKKIPRPKVVIANPAVQAICPKQVVKVDRNAELQASIERRRTLLHSSSIVPYYTPEEYAQFVSKYEAFVQDYIKNKKPSVVSHIGSPNATEKILNRSDSADKNN